MNKVARISAAVLLAALILPLMFSAVHADKVVAFVNGHSNVYVDASRPDNSGSGSSWATAKKTIAAAISIVDHPGGTIHVAAGTYRENLYLDDSFIMVGAGAPVTVIDGGGAWQVIRASSYFGQENTISGFTIQNGKVNGSAAVEQAMLPQGLLGNGMPVGGGVYVGLDHTLTMNDCVIRNNTASFLGGGIYNAGRLYMNGCTVSGNSAGMVGGGIANFSDEGDIGFMKLTNCTISGNSVTGASLVTTVVPSDAVDEPGLFGMPQLWIGGGVFNGGDAEFWNVTIAGNTVPSNQNSHGGGIANVPLQCTNDATEVSAPIEIKNRAMFVNTIVANNVPDNGYKDAKAVIWSLGNNIDSQDNCGFDRVSDQVNTNPLLGLLQDNGGPTPTMAICTNSPAFNRGTDYSPVNDSLSIGIYEIPDIDQRGVARPQAGIYDIGAFETVPISVSTLDAGTAAVTTATFNGNLLSGIGGAPVYVSFQYGSSQDSYTGNTAPQLVTSTGPFSAVVTGLPFGMCYYRAVATGDCTAYGQANKIAILPPLGNSGSSNPASGTGPGSFVGMPNITVVSASLSSASASPGSPVTVTANIANRGTVNGTAAVKLYVNGQEDTSRGITVNSGSNVPMTFTVSRNEPGTYTVYVGGTPAGSFTVGASSDADIILYISAGLVAAALIAFLFYMRRRQGSVKL